MIKRSTINEMTSGCEPKSIVIPPGKFTLAVEAVENIDERADGGSELLTINSVKPGRPIRPPGAEDFAIILGDDFDRFAWFTETLGVKRRFH
jgi:hypothetical protein